MRKIHSYLNVVITYYEVFGLKSIFYLILWKLFRANIVAQIKSKVLKKEIGLRIGTSDIATYRDIFLSEEYMFHPISKIAMIVDAGANIGLAALYFASRFPDAKIIALEPEISNFEMLKKNCNEYSNIVTLNMALWSSQEKLTVVDNGLDKWGFQMVPATATADANKIIEGISIEDLMNNYNLSSIDILKIDIEGGEKVIFNKTPSWIKNVTTLIIELHDQIMIGCNRSFYLATNDIFKYEWRRGENIFLSNDTHK